jgi:hypothetical protein
MIETGVAVWMPLSLWFAPATFSSPTFVAGLSETFSSAAEGEAGTARCATVSSEKIS